MQIPNDFPYSVATSTNRANSNPSNLSKTSCRMTSETLVAVVATIKNGNSSPSMLQYIAHCVLYDMSVCHGCTIVPADPTKVPRLIIYQL